jgi:uncharacterized membrane protein YkvA (DUF1232 family)
VLDIVIGIALAIVLAWGALVAFLFAAGRSTPGARDVLRLLPDTLRLLRALASDPAVPRGPRVRLWLLLAYLASPIDLIPDFIPVIGYLDDAIIVAFVLRGVARAAGAEVLRRRWPGTDDGLRALMNAAGIASDQV